MFWLSIVAFCTMVNLTLKKTSVAPPRLDAPAHAHFAVKAGLDTTRGLLRAMQHLLPYSGEIASGDNHFECVRLSSSGGRLSSPPLLGLIFSSFYPTLPTPFLHHPKEAYWGLALAVCGLASHLVLRPRAGAPTLLTACFSACLSHF